MLQEKEMISCRSPVKFEAPTAAGAGQEPTNPGGYHRHWLEEFAEPRNLLAEAQGGVGAL